MSIEPTTTGARLTVPLLLDRPVLRSKFWGRTKRGWDEESIVLHSRVVLERSRLAAGSAFFVTSRKAKPQPVVAALKPTHNFGNQNCTVFCSFVEWFP